MGLTIRIRPAEDIGHAIWHLGVYDLPVTELIWRLLDPGDSALDVGANIGYMTGVMAARVGTRGQVWSFEPHPVVFTDLQANVAGWSKTAHAGSIKLHQMALGDRAGQFVLSEPEAFDGNRGTASITVESKKTAHLDAVQRTVEHTVTVDRLDALSPVGARWALAKIDVEGFELAVLKGAVRLLEENAIRDILFEDHGEYPTPVTQFLEERGFALFQIEKKLLRLRLRPPGKRASHTAWLPQNFLATRDPARAQARLAGFGWHSLAGKL